ncbi:uncharacterized protein LOC114774242 isoform X2 [Denticeps clupeoides]|uniref:uncharacterized protein LOC114774242 isoform X2 n=1 Tax=Denticeps clupeoides TaxID=299321 RepID=UPI0010A44440|nr:uncharacterized protein LOC114774242 isoform X2 [Denticeps clupeoides]
MQDRMMMMMVVLSIVPILESGIVTAASKDQSLKGFIFQQKGLPDNLIRIGMGDTVFDKEDLLPLKPCSESAWPSPGHFICCETENEQAAVIWVGDEDPQPEGIVDKKVVVLSTRKLENPLKTISPPASFRSTSAAPDQPDQSLMIGIGIGVIAVLLVLVILCVWGMCRFCEQRDRQGLTNGVV